MTALNPKASGPPVCAGGSRGSAAFTNPYDFAAYTEAHRVRTFLADLEQDA